MENNLKYGFRKSKVARSLCGAVLGAAVIASIGAVSASADEVTAEPEKTVVKAGEESVTAQSEQEKEQPSSNVDEFKGLDKTPVEVEKVEKSTPVVENPNPTPAEPKQPEFKPEVKTTENSVETVADKTGSNELNFSTKAPTNTKTESTVAPLTIDHVYDYSSSYAGKVKDSLRLSKKIIEANSPESKHILQLYPDNYGQTSYHASGKKAVGGTHGVSSVVLTKQEALNIIDKLLAINAPTEKNPTYQNYGAYFQGLADALGDKRYLDESAKELVPFESIVEKLTKPTETVSVIQYTDGWMDKGKVEEMDKSFAEWAKKRAKTFMSVVNRNQVTPNDTNSNRSLEQMRELGHPNIYDMTGKDPKVVDAEVIKQFLETATEKVKVTKGADQTANITIGGAGIKITKATLKGGSVNKELPIKDGKVDFSEKLPDGSYTIQYTFVGEGTVTGTVALDGKEAAKKADTLSSKGGFVKADFRTNDGRALPGKNDLTISEAGKTIGADWKAPIADKSIVVNGQTYILVGVPKTQAGKVTKDNVTLHYVYQAKPSDKKVYTVTFKVLNAVTGKQIDKEFVAAKGFESDSYNVLSPKVDGYEVTLKEGSATGKFANKDVTLTYLAHEKGGQVKAIFTDESGKELKDSEIIAETGKLVGSSWKYDSELQKEIKVGDKTYILTAVPERLQGEVTSENQTLKFVYKLKEEPKPEQPAKKVAKPVAKPITKTLPKTSAYSSTSSSNEGSYGLLAAGLVGVSLTVLGLKKQEGEN